MAGPALLSAADPWWPWRPLTARAPRRTLIGCPALRARFQFCTPIGPVPIRRSPFGAARCRARVWKRRQPYGGWDALAARRTGQPGGGPFALRSQAQRQRRGWSRAVIGYEASEGSAGARSLLCRDWLMLVAAGHRLVPLRSAAAPA